MSYTIIDEGTDRATWLHARLSGATATDIASLHHGGASARASLLAEKRGKINTFTGNAYTDHGHAREAYVLGWVETMFDIHPSTKLVAAADNPRHMATPDGIGDDAGAEGKTTSKPWPARDDVPPRYITQCQWGMRVTGFDRWLFAWEEHKNFIPTHMEPKWFWIDRDDALIAELTDIADEFLSELDSPYQPTKYDELIATYNQRRAVVQIAQADLDETDAALRELLAGVVSEKVVTPFGNLTWSTPKPRETFDSTRFRVEHPDMFALYVKESQAKPSLRVTEARED